jgi:hypothetical protein
MLSCDRACLLAIADSYLSALVAHDPSKAPIAPNAKFTEQAQVMAVGEGSLWKNATSVSTTFKIPVPDPVAGQIGMIVMMKESSGTADPDRDVEVALRLKVVNRQITEAEHNLARITNPAALANLQTRGRRCWPRSPGPSGFRAASCCRSEILTTIPSCRVTVKPLLMQTTAAAAKMACTRPAPARLLQAAPLVEAVRCRVAAIR